MANSLIVSIAPTTLLGIGGTEADGVLSWLTWRWSLCGLPWSRGCCCTDSGGRVNPAAGLRAIRRRG
jgi:hypothetical protein